MASAKHTDPIFHDESAARAHFEALRWPNGRVCPHCGSIGTSTELKGQTTRPGLYKCREKDCRKPFTATMGTVYENSHIPLTTWLYATHLMCASKKGVSAAQLHRMLGFGSYRSAWFMAHRIREAMRAEDLPPMGSGGGTVEVDETYIGQSANGKKTRLASTSMNRVMTLVDRSSGRARSFVIADFKITTIEPILLNNISPEARLMTDEAHAYKAPGKAFADHRTVNHAKKEYVSRTDPTCTTNTIEGFFGIFKRGMRGIYQHCGSQHLQRYMTEFDFRYTNRAALGIDDTARANLAIMGAVGRRLKYQRPATQVAAQA